MSLEGQLPIFVRPYDDLKAGRTDHVNDVRQGRGGGSGLRRGQAVPCLRNCPSPATAFRQRYPAPTGQQPRHAIMDAGWFPACAGEDVQDTAVPPGLFHNGSESKMLDKV